MKVSVTLRDMELTALLNRAHTETLLLTHYLCPGREVLHRLLVQLMPEKNVNHSITFIPLINLSCVTVPLPHVSQISIWGSCKSGSRAGCH